MPQSLALLLTHIVFSTKDRPPFLKSEIRKDLHAYLATVARNLECECFLVGGVEDHVHLAIGLSRTITVAKLVEQLKTTSSQLAEDTIFTQFLLAERIRDLFGEPTSASRIEALHFRTGNRHKRSSFQDELRILLTKYGIAFDERYLWD